eukprot:TRINITY_DN2092_c0_g1_i2.p1 TRINITY_DN2092_c0_g1~~TRINITY_DN2092_c0_g1_i2.p1  ORF type:complete len:256 (-),score=98.41 TRINITY_DN2092_c0_g1_i2:229-996(-)
MSSGFSAFDKLNSYDIFTKTRTGEDGEGLSSGHICLKRTIIAVNVFFLILGIIMTAVGSAGASNTYAEFAGNSLPVGVLVLGVFMMVIAFMGCCGAKRESRALLGIYSLILIILIVCQIGVGIAIYAKQDDAPDALRSAWDGANNWQRTVIQDSLECCGLEIYNLTQPVGVIKPITGLAGQPCPDPIKYPKSVGKTCLSIMVEKIRSSYVTVGVVAIVFALLQIIGFMFALCLIRGIRLARDQEQMVDGSSTTYR